MNILHVNSLIDGGAAIAVKRIHNGLLDIDVKSYYLFNKGKAEDSSFINWREIQNKNLSSRVIKILDILSWKRQKRLREESLFLNARPQGFELFSPIKSDIKLRLKDIPIRPDIVHLHWVADFFDYDTFFSSIPDDFPIVWTLHDMNPFTGGCHYSWDCKRYMESCGNCPQLANSSAKDLSNKILSYKKNILGNKSIHVVADSHWIEEQAKKSSVFQHASSIRTIHYGVEIDILKAREKVSCKRALGINPDCKVIVFGADGVNNRRKGLAELASAIKILKKSRSDVFFLTFGDKPEIFNGDAEFVKHAGYISSLEILTILYSAADVFVMPSLYEAFGQVALEAMSCGVPVISFNNGGASDIVINGVTGLLAERGDVSGLADKLLTILSSENELRDMGENARNMVVKNFSKNKQALKYKNLYREICLNC